MGQTVSSRGASTESCPCVGLPHPWKSGVTLAIVRRVFDTGVGVYPITSSARCRSDCGILSPRTFAVLRLMTSSNLVGCSTGSKAGPVGHEAAGVNRCPDSSRT
jgi:hypothetical protein